MKRTAFSMAFCGLATLLPASAGAQASAPPGEWKFSLTPYLWMPTVGSTVQYTLPASFGGGTATVEKDPGDYLSNLDMALMLSGEARKGRWAVFTDIISSGRRAAGEIAISKASATAPFISVLRTGCSSAM